MMDRTVDFAGSWMVYASGESRLIPPQVQRERIVRVVLGGWNLHRPDGVAHLEESQTGGTDESLLLALAVLFRILSSIVLWALASLVPRVRLNPRRLHRNHAKVLEQLESPDYEMRPLPAVAGTLPDDCCKKAPRFRRLRLLGPPGTELRRRGERRTVDRGPRSRGPRGEPYRADVHGRPQRRLALSRAAQSRIR